MGGTYTFNSTSRHVTSQPSSLLSKTILLRKVFDLMKVRPLIVLVAVVLVMLEILVILLPPNTLIKVAANTLTVLRMQL